MEIIDFLNLNTFNKSIQEKAEAGAQMLDITEFRTIYNYMRRYINTYNSFACEMMISIDIDLMYISQEERESIIKGVGELIRTALRKSDIMTPVSNSFVLLLPELTEQDKITVINRIKDRIFETELYNIVTMRVDSQVITPEVNFETWIRMAV